MPITNSILNSKKLNVLPLRSIIRLGYLLLLLLASAIKPAIRHSNITVFRLKRKKKNKLSFFHKQYNNLYRKFDEIYKIATINIK